MKIQKAIELGFKKDDYGIWRRPIIQNTKRGIVHTWQKYISRICEKCANEFLASNRTAKFCSITCQMRDNQYTKGKKLNRKKSYRVNQHGYVWVLEPSHPFANKKGYVAEHRFIMEKKIGRILQSHEIVHHISGDRHDNRIENLVLTNRSNHNSIHKSEEIKHRKRDEKGRLIQASSS